MIALSEIPSWVYKILLVLAAMIWGFSFVVMKDVVTVMPPAWLLGIRFTLAGFILLFILRKRVKAHFSKRALGAGMVLAVFDFQHSWRKLWACSMQRRALTHSLLQRTVL